MKVLIYCPLNPRRPRIFARSLQSILTLEWDGPAEIVFGRDDNPPLGQAGYDNLLEKHNRARELALAGGYDALFLVEADMIVPSDALVRLAQVDADVAYGLYCSRHGRYQWLAFSEISESSGKSIDRNRRFCVDHWGKVIPTVGVGMGCTLIHRRVLEAMPFRRYGACADDWYFSLDCIARGFTQAHDLGVVCGHILSDGAPKILWPTISDPDFLYEYEFFDRPEMRERAS